jgi:predicted GNAT family N-acyltransferase
MLMTVEYRGVQPHEEEALLTLRIEVFRGTDRARWREQFMWDAHRFRHTYVAVAADGTILASVRYLLRHMRDSHGHALRIGWVTNVATKPEAQHQGHGGQLLALTSAAMRQAGCRCALLSGEEAVAGFYEQYGWQRFPYPYRQGLLASQPLPTRHAYVAASLTRSRNRMAGNSSPRSISTIIRCVP